MLGGQVQVGFLEARMGREPMGIVVRKVILGGCMELLHGWS